MKRLWVAEDIYAALKDEQCRRGGLTISRQLRKFLRLPHKTYSGRPRVKSKAVKEGIAKAKQHGMIVGRPKFPEYARERVRELRKKSKWSIWKIMLASGMSRSTVKRVLRER